MITEETYVTGNIYFICRQPPNVIQNLVGKGGICRWGNYRGIFMIFSNGTACVIPYYCIYDNTQNAAA